MSASTEQETQLCGNCKKDIPAANFTIHDIHCWRNIALCQICDEPFPKSEMKEHMETEHVQITCKCNVKMDKSEIETHEMFECPLRLVKCQYCELELGFNKSVDHDAYCGARTEPCRICGNNVMLKDLDNHPSVCGKEAKENNNKVKPSPLYNLDNDAGAWFETLPFGSFSNTGGAYLRSIRRMARPQQSRFRSTLDVDAPWRRFERPTVTARTVDQNRVDERERIEKNRGTGPVTCGDENSNLDYMLALSLQSEHNSGGSVDEEIQAGVLRHCHSSRLEPFEDHAALFNEKAQTFPLDMPSNVDDGEKNTDGIMLPCEFCEELFPEEDLVVHQTGCNTASAFASFSKDSPSTDVQLEQDGLFRRFSEPSLNHAILDNTSESTYFGSSMVSEDGVFIPCEFCGIPLEDEILFHHQDKCEFRPATARPTERPPAGQRIPKKENTEKKQTPELTRRRSRYQEDFDGNYVDDVSPHRGFYRATSHMRPPKSSGISRTTPQRFSADVNAGSSSSQYLARTGKFASQVGTEMKKSKKTPEFKPIVFASRGSGKPFTESHDHSFPRTSPNRYGPSLKTEASKSPRTTAAPNLRSRTTKAGSKKPQVEDIDKAEE